jgi:hypothetical protein
MFMELAVFVCSLASRFAGLFERPTGPSGPGTSIFHLAATGIEYLGLAVKKLSQLGIRMPKTFAKRANRNEQARSLHFDALRPGWLPSGRAVRPFLAVSLHRVFIATLAPSLLIPYS